MSRLAHIAGRALDWGENLFAGIAGVLLVGGIGTVIAEVVVRYFTGRSFTWVIEINENFMVYIPFLAAAWVLRRRGHLTIDLLEPLLRGPVRRGVDALVGVVGAGASAIFLYYGAVLTAEAYGRGLVSLSITRIPEWYVLVSLPIGGGLVMLEFVRQFFETISGEEPDETREAPPEEGV